MYLKDPPIRNRKLLDLAHQVTECQNCGAWTEGCDPAHSDRSEDGKATSQKAHDHLHSALCRACHVWYDSVRHGKDPSGCFSPDERHEMWERAHHRTFTHYWRSGWLTVK